MTAKPEAAPDDEAMLHNIKYAYDTGDSVAQSACWEALRRRIAGLRAEIADWEIDHTKIGTQEAIERRAEAAERELAACKQELANVDNARLAVLAAMRPIPAGWRLVPVELTDDMIAAFLREFQRHPKHFETAKIWAAMLAAAPEAPLEDTTVADRLAAARGLLNSIDGPEAPR